MHAEHNRCFRVPPTVGYAPCTREKGHDGPCAHEPEAVNHPPHYGGDTTYEAIKVIEAWELGFCLGNTVKYICRAGNKATESEVKDLKKALWYLQRRIQQLEKQ